MNKITRKEFLKGAGYSVSALALSTIMPDAFATDVSEQTVVTDSPLQSKIDMSLLYSDIAPTNAAQRISNNETKQETRLERHERLISEGWVLKELYVEDISLQENILTKNATYSSTIIEDMKAVTAVYTQPIVKKSVKNSALLNAIDNVNNVVMTAVGTLKYAWVPSLLGLSLQNITDFISRGETNFTVAETLFYYDIDVKTAGWPYYYMMASSQQLSYASTMIMTGYFDNGMPYSKSSDVAKDSSSPYYGNEPVLSEKARYHVMLNDGSFYREQAERLGVLVAEHYA